MELLLQQGIEKLAQDMIQLNKGELYASAIAIRKDIFVIQGSLPLRHYEQVAAARGILVHPFQQEPVKKMLFDFGKQFCLAKGLEYFGFEIADMYFTEWKYNEKTIEGYLIGKFPKAIARGCTSAYCQIESKLVYALTSQLRALFGKGPQKCRAVSLGIGLMFYEVNGLLSQVTHEYLCQNKDELLKKHVQAAVQTAVGNSHTEIFGLKPMIYLAEDYKQNNVAIIAKWDK